MGLEAVLMNRLFVTIVMYERSWQEASASPLLEKAVKNQQIQLLVYDNSPQSHDEPFFQHPLVSYFHDPANPGLSKAYNKGFKSASSGDFDLLLLLDQDTELTKAYLNFLMTETIGTEIGAVVPLIYSVTIQVSPVLADRYINRNLAYPAIGEQKQRIMAINSGTAVTLAAIKKIGGFNDAFPLDFLDHWLFLRLHQEGFRFLIANQKLNHDLSVMHYKTMTRERYEQILTSESKFYRDFDKEKKKEHEKQLFFRTIKQALSPKMCRFSRRTWKEYLSFRKDHL